jgi:hypothetical protein
MISGEELTSPGPGVLGCNLRLPAPEFHRWWETNWARPVPRLCREKCHFIGRPVRLRIHLPSLDKCPIHFLIRLDSLARESANLIPGFLESGIVRSQEDFCAEISLRCSDEHAVLSEQMNRRASKILQAGPPHGEGRRDKHLI